MYSEDLEIVISANSNLGEVLQTSTFGDGARGYRIDTESELYITNFPTLSTPKTYVVEVYRYRAGGTLIGSFELSTVK